MTAQRMNIMKVVPHVYRAMVAFDVAARQDLDPTLYELVKIRASQINHCAYCIDMHTQDARAAGESEQRLHLLSAWEEAGGFFTEKEQAALALTEAMTVITDGFVPDEVYERAARHYDETELAQLIAAIAAINSWNRLMVTVRGEPGHYQPGQHRGQ